ncbi:pentatricopeptide repeat-containing protein, partial [Trifolium medium]|nr:pentatricopeptide repeat-containing protein [Trifolium medium]
MAGLHRKAKVMFDDMREKGIYPSVVTYTVLIHSYAVRGMLDHATSYLLEMKN